MRTYVSNAVWALWLQRYIYFHRLLRLGYNGLLIDADIVFFHEPYRCEALLLLSVLAIHADVNRNSPSRYLKRELAAYTLISLCDSSAGVTVTNGGVWYVQNASLNGPVIGLFEQFEKHVMKLLSDAVAT